MRIGYMRVSTGEQSLDLHDALRLAGCERIYEDICSGRVAERPGLSQALNAARQGDALVVWKLAGLAVRYRTLSDWLAICKSGASA